MKLGSAHLLCSYVPMDSLRCFSAIAHSVHDKAWSTHIISACKNTRNARHLVRVHSNPAPIVDGHLGKVTLRRERHRIKTVGNQHGLGRHRELGIPNGTRFSAAAGIRIAQLTPLTLPAISPSREIGLVRKINFAPSSSALAYSLALPGIFARSRR